MTTTGGVVNYRYNGFEQRVYKTGPMALISTGAAYYVYNESGQLVGEYDASGTPIYETVYLGASPVGVLKQTGTAAGSNIATSIYNVYSDHLATPRVITRATDESIVWRWDSAEAFGATAPDQNPNNLGTFTFNQRLPGQVFDAETGLFQNWNREYNARLGRYIQSDPIGLRGGINTYGYVGGNPLSYADPTGEFAWGLAFAAADLAWQLYQNGGQLKCVNWTDVGLSMLGGGLTNALFNGVFRFKTVGKNTWDATRKWMNKERIQVLNHEQGRQHRHHWLLERNQGIGKDVADAVKNQPWNTNPISAEFNAWLASRPKLAWLGAPSWVPEVLGGGATATGSAMFGDDDDCSCSK